MENSGKKVGKSLEESFQALIGKEASNELKRLNVKIYCKILKGNSDSSILPSAPKAPNPVWYKPKKAPLIRRMKRIEADFIILKIINGRDFLFISLKSVKSAQSA